VANLLKAAQRRLERGDESIDALRLASEELAQRACARWETTSSSAPPTSTPRATKLARRFVTVAEHGDLSRLEALLVAGGGTMARIMGLPHDAL
jgi:hypothetical protein